MRADGRADVRERRPADWVPTVRPAQISNNFIKRIEGLHMLPCLQTLQIAHNSLASADDVRGLLHCPSLSVVDLQHNKLDDPEVVGVLEAMPQLAVVQMQGNPLINSVPQYRRTLVSRCKALTYVDDRPVFPEDRLATEAWAWAEKELGPGTGLEAERQERARQREEKEANQKRNLEYMRQVTEDAKARAEQRMRERGQQPTAHDQIEHAAADGGTDAAAPGEKKAHTSEQLYNRALAAVEAKRCARAREVERTRSATSSPPPPHRAARRDSLTRPIPARAAACAGASSRRASVLRPRLTQRLPAATRRVPPTRYRHRAQRVRARWRAMSPRAVRARARAWPRARASRLRARTRRRKRTSMHSTESEPLRAEGCKPRVHIGGDRPAR